MSKSAAKRAPPIIDDQRHTSGSITATILSWARKTIGPDGVDRLLAAAGEIRSPEVLEDETTWSNYQQVTDLLQAAIAVTGHPDAARLIGMEMLSQLIGTEVGALLQSLGSPGELLRNIAASGAKFTTTLVMEASEITENAGVVSVRTVEGIPRFQVDCDLTAGMLSICPALFGLEAASIWESECQAQGGDQCVYHVEWNPSRADHSRADLAVDNNGSDSRDLNKRFQALQRMATDLVSAEDIESLLALVTRRAGTAVRAPQYLLAVRLGGQLRVHSDGLGPQEAEAVAAELMAPDPDDHGGSRLIVDVASGEHHYGRLAAIYPKGSHFFPQERDLFAAYAAHAAAVLNTAAALEESRRQNRTSSALLSLARALSEVSSSGEVASKLAWAVTEVVPCEDTYVLLWDEATERLRLAAAIGVSERVEKLLTEVGIGVEDTAEISRMLNLPAASFMDYDTADEYHRQLMKPGGTSTAIVPIVSRGTFFGVIAVGINRPLADLRHDSDLIERLTGIAGQAGTALENAVLLDQVRHQALHDPLTGLPNRSLLNDRAERALVEAARDHDRVALAFIDLDHFKKVNDTLGHGEGDELLIQVAKRLAGSLRASDTVVRLGGDEFVILISHVRHPEEALAVAEKVNACLAAPFQVKDHEIFVTASVGLSVGPVAGGEYEFLLKQADMAMFRAKAQGGDQVLVFEGRHDKPVHDVLALEADLHSAIERDQLRVVYQPQIDLADGRLVGVEALVRWAHPRLGLLEPCTFLSLAEESDVVVDMDLWVLGQAVDQTALWRDRFGQEVRMAVNLSSRTANSARLAPAVTVALTRAGLTAALLELEITEKVVDYGAGALRRIVERLRALGVQVAIDDFGTGSSSFGRVHGIQVDTLKIDRSLLQDLTTNPQTAPMLAAMLHMGDALGLRVVAEGVELAKQAEWLRDNSCTLAQGYLFSRPTLPENIEEMFTYSGPLPALGPDFAIKESGLPVRPEAVSDLGRSPA
ncbi:MAG: EAL domain-containing protein [Acidimicrobiales bacterium]